MKYSATGFFFTLSLISRVTVEAYVNHNAFGENDRYPEDEPCRLPTRSITRSECDQICKLNYGESFRGVCEPTLCECISEIRKKPRDDFTQSSTKCMWDGISGPRPVTLSGCSLLCEETRGVSWVGKCRSWRFDGREYIKCTCTKNGREIENDIPRYDPPRSKCLFKGKGPDLDRAGEPEEMTNKECSLYCSEAENKKGSCSDGFCVCC